VRLVLLLLFVAAALVGCSSPPEKKIIPRSELEKMTADEKPAAR